MTPSPPRLPAHRAAARSPPSPHSAQPRPAADRARPGAGGPARSPRPIPSTGEPLPIVGLGSWITFNVGNDRALREQCTAVMRAFFEAGGRLIDSSPMYGSSQDVIGDGPCAPRAVRARSSPPTRCGSARARAVPPRSRPRGSSGASRASTCCRSTTSSAWQEHLPTLTGDEARRPAALCRHHDLRRATAPASSSRSCESIRSTSCSSATTCSIAKPKQRLLPLARERRMAVIVNRPFRQGDLTRALARSPLPAWAAEIDCTTWAQVLLKFILAHPR